MHEKLILRQKVNINIKKGFSKRVGILSLWRNYSNSNTMLPPVASRNFDSKSQFKSSTTKSRQASSYTTKVAASRRYRSSGSTVSVNVSASIAVNNCQYTYSSSRLTALRNSNLSKAIIGEQKGKDKGRLTVVLDVDETLIHSRLSPGQDRFRQAEERKDQTQSCEEFKITLEDGETIWVNKRPGLDKFLKLMSERYETIAYTAALEEYAKPLLDWLDPNGTIFRHRLYRDSCLFIRGYYVKDLQKVNRSLKRAVLVDNNAFCFLPQLSNGIPISSFYDDPSDNALSVLTTYLERLDEEKDVRPVLNKSFNLQNLLKEHREHIIG